MTISIYRWFCLTIGLRKRGQGLRESGAFLIAKTGSSKISTIVFYDELDSEVFKSGIIVLNGLGHAKLGEILTETKSEVIADIHTHPIGCSTRQSDSDQKHPMARLKGHIAFIAPDFALKRFLMPWDCSSYLYQGAFQWQTLKGTSFPLKLTLI